jgi:hypothetical protein
MMNLLRLSLIPLMSRRRAQLCLRLVITGLVVVAGLAWFVSEQTRDQFDRWLTIGDWLLEIGLMWLIICFLTYPRWLRRSTLAYLSMLVAVFYLFVGHFLVHNMYTGATYRMASAALGVGTAFVVLLNVWLLRKAVPGIGERQIRLGNVLLSSLAALTMAFGERFLPTLDKWHPFPP